MSDPGSAWSICFIFLSFFSFFLQFWLHWAGIQTFHLFFFFLLLWWKHQDSFSPVILGCVIMGSICFLFLPSQHSLAARGDLGNPPALPCPPCPWFVPPWLCSGLIFHQTPPQLGWKSWIKRRCFGHVGSIGSSPKTNLGTEFFSHLCENL